MYDPKCEELARHFLPESTPDSTVRDLAQHVQNEIEVWLEMKAETLCEAILQRQMRQ